MACIRAVLSDTGTHQTTRKERSRKINGLATDLTQPHDIRANGRLSTRHRRGGILSTLSPISYSNNQLGLAITPVVSVFRRQGLRDRHWRLSWTTEHDTVPRFQKELPIYLIHNSKSLKYLHDFQLIHSTDNKQPFAFQFWCFLVGIISKNSYHQSKGRQVKKASQGLTLFSHSNSAHI